MVLEGHCNSNNDNEFTLVELVVVIAILGIIVAISIVKYTNLLKRTKEKVCHYNCVKIERVYQE